MVLLVGNGIVLDYHVPSDVRDNPDGEINVFDTRVWFYGSLVGSHNLLAQVCTCSYGKHNRQHKPDGSGFVVVVAINGTVGWYIRINKILCHHYSADMCTWFSGLPVLSLQNRSPIIRRVRKAALTCIASCLTWACSTEPYQGSEPYTPHIDARLTRDGSGFYHLVLNREKYQTVHRVSGSLLDAYGKPPSISQKVHWESSHSWSFMPGDTVVTIYRRNVDHNGRWVVVDTQIVRAPAEMIVPTVNPTSYSDSDGEINTMIGPVLSMLGDTMTITCRWWDEWYQSDTNSASVSIILE